ncbi:hypothetical protein [Rheinheimera aquimaris]|uniref:hypothetical protein n=1 Tax=Rheinheimera aquimaris TaxID=412437 RepID=UPI001E4DDE41|nr:hypothetical protein [Rheinheimera aquimaris]MCD1599895.1 hypothetical protein [Rheinheimera aquimaris]
MAPHYRSKNEQNGLTKKCQAGFAQGKTGLGMEGDSCVMLAGHRGGERKEFLVWHGCTIEYLTPKCNPIKLCGYY